MSALLWVHPEWGAPVGALLAIAGLLLGLSAWRARRRRRRLLGGWGRIAHPALRSDALLWLAALAIGVALLGPRFGERTLRQPAGGVDVVFALDVSHSMDASDVPPSRLDRARRAVSELVARLQPRDRVGLVAFAGGAALLAPLTPDRDLLAELLGGIDTDLILPRASDLASGVRRGIAAFEEGSDRPRVLVLLSDGEDPEHRRELAAADAARAGVRVLALGFGSEAGATLPDHGVPLVDAGGRTVVSRRDLPRLEALAAATGGVAFAADRWGALDFDAVAAALHRDAGSAGEAFVERKVRAVQFAPFAALAFALLLLEGLPRPQRRRRAGAPLHPSALPARARRAAGVASALLLALAIPPGGRAQDAAAPGSLSELEARVRARPEDPAALVALGAARLERGRRGAAARAFLAAALRARDPQAAALAYYDLGVARLEQEDLPAARQAFLDALALDPGDEKARFNLEWTLLALRQQDLRSEVPDEPPPAPEEEPSPEAEEPESVPELPEPEAERRVEEPPPLSEAQQQRLLERIEDDPGRALRSAARDARERKRRSSGAIAW